MKCIGIAVHPLPQGKERATEVETTPLFPLRERRGRFENRTVIA
jgi:hypothetical protein